MMSSAGVSRNGSKVPSSRFSLSLPNTWNWKMKVLHDVLHLVFDEMDGKGLRFLAVLDGFDHVLAGSGITRNLWDDMRTLCQKASLRLVTGSRSRLRELCKTEDSRTSDFWEIFYDTPLQVGCFEDHDWSGFLDPFKLRGVTFDGSALKEITNWTGGVPVLAAALAERLLAKASDGVTISKPHVDSNAEATAEERRGLLTALWDDCPDRTSVRSRPYSPTATYHSPKFPTTGGAISNYGGSPVRPETNSGRRVA